MHTLAPCESPAKPGARGSDCRRKDERQPHLRVGWHGRAAHRGDAVRVGRSSFSPALTRTLGAQAGSGHRHGGDESQGAARAHAALPVCQHGGGTQYEHGTYATITLTEAAKVKFPNVPGASQFLCARRPMLALIIHVPAAAGEWLHLKALTVKREDRGAATRARARVVSLTRPPSPSLSLSAGLVLEISDKCTPYQLAPTHELVQDLLRLALRAVGGRGVAPDRLLLLLRSQAL
jgi:hypothetical protein